MLYDLDSLLDGIADEHGAGEQHLRGSGLRPRDIRRVQERRLRGRARVSPATALWGRRMSGVTSTTGERRRREGLVVLMLGRGDVI